MKFSFCLIFLIGCSIILAEENVPPAIEEEPRQFINNNIPYFPRKCNTRANPWPGTDPDPDDPPGQGGPRPGGPRPGGPRPGGPRPGGPRPGGPRPPPTTTTTTTTTTPRPGPPHHGGFPWPFGYPFYYGIPVPVLGHGQGHRAST